MQLSKAQMAEFEEEGYVFLPDVFSRAEIAVLNAEVPGIFAQQREEVWREKDGKAVRTAFAAHTYNEAFRRLGAHPRLIGPVMQVLGGPVYMHQFKINGKEAFDGDVWQWHQDYGTWARDDLMPEPRAMNVAVFLDEVNEFNGALMFIPKSHKGGVLEAGHDLLTTSYPLWTLDKETIARLVEEG
ncbi:MAG: phytanoyl-CoA dioxygenase family protein, partial [Kiloniellales bacterium]